MSIKDTVLSSSPDLTNIINKALKRIGENHSLSRDNKGITITNKDIEAERNNTTKVIEESLKAVADEMAQKLVLENTIDGMVKDVINEQDYTKYDNEMQRAFMSALGFNYPDKHKTVELLKYKDYLEKYKLKDSDDVKKRYEELVKKADSKVTIKESIKDDKVKLDEATTNTIKKLVNKKLKDKINERQSMGNAVPGLDAYNKAIKKSKAETDTYHKDVKKKFKDYENFEGNESPEFPHQENSKTNADGQFQYYRNDDEDQEFVDDFAHPGLIDFDIHNLNMDRLTKYLEGSSETGNAQTDKDGEALGNVIPSETGKRMTKSAERRKEKIAKQKAAMSNLRRYTPDVQKVTNVKEEVSQDITDMKKLWVYNKITQ